MSQQEWWAAEDRVERLRALLRDGLSAAQIAKELGTVTRNAVLGKIHRLGLSKSTGDLRLVPRMIRVQNQLTGTIHFRQLRPPPAPLPGEVNLMDATARQCRYIKDEASAMMVCGQPTVARTAWCQEHARMCYYPRARS